MDEDQEIIDTVDAWQKKASLRWEQQWTSIFSLGAFLVGAALIFALDIPFAAFAEADWGVPISAAVFSVAVSAAYYGVADMPTRKRGEDQVPFKKRYAAMLVACAAVLSCSLPAIFHGSESETQAKYESLRERLNEEATQHAERVKELNQRFDRLEQRYEARSVLSRDDARWRRHQARVAKKRQAR